MFVLLSEPFAESPIGYTDKLMLMLVKGNQDLWDLVKIHRCSRKRRVFTEKLTARCSVNH